MAFFHHKKQTALSDLGIYIHIPFCAHKCDYCDFYSVPGRDRRMDEYRKALRLHLRESAPQAEGYGINSIYFGGGTPSFFGASRLCDLLECIRKNYTVAADCEITAECNPESADADLLSALHRAGVNRISLGMQSSSDEELLRVGRIHSAAQTERAFHRAREAGFDNISLDLIYGLPGQTIESWQHSVEAALALNPEHLSCYGLKLEKETPLWLRRKEEEMADDDMQAEMYLWMVKRLADAGYEQYEISNFAKPNRHSRHNLKYWLGEEYMGFGPSAASCFGNCRYTFVRDLDAYLEGLFGDGQLISESSDLSRRERAKEYLMLRMRTVRGVEEAEYRSRFYMNFTPLEERFREYRDYGWAEYDDGRWHFTPKGFLVSNPLIGDLLAIQEEEALETMRPLYEKRRDAEQKNTEKQKPPSENNNIM